MAIDLKIESTSGVQAVADVRRELKGGKEDTAAFRAEVKKLQADFEASLNAAYGLPVKRALADIRDAANAADDAVKRLGSNLQRMSANLPSTARAGLAAIALEAQRSASAVSGMGSALGSARAQITDAASGMKLLADQTRSAVIEGGKLQEVYRQIGQQRRPAIAGANPQQRLLPAPAATTSPASPNNVIDARPLNAMELALGNVKTAAMAAAVAIGGVGASLLRMATPVNIINALSSAFGRLGSVGNGAASLVASGMSMLGSAARSTLYGALVGTVLLGHGLGAVASGARTAFGHIVNYASPVIGALGSVKNAISSTIGYFAKLTGMPIAISTIPLGLLAREFFQTADAVTLFQRKIESIATTPVEAGQIRAAVLGIAETTRSSITEVTTDFSKFFGIMKSAGNSIDTTRSMIEGYGLALKLGGASTQEAHRASVQFFQGVAKGKFELQDLKSILQSSPALIQRMADAFGGSWPKMYETIKQGGEIGQQTMSKILTGIASGRDAMERQFAAMPRTIGEAMTQLKNQWFLTVEAINNKTAAGDAMVRAVDAVRSVIASSTFTQGLAGMISAIAQGAEGLAKWVTTGDDLATRFKILGVEISYVGSIIKAAISDFSVLRASANGITGMANGGLNALSQAVNGRDAKVQIPSPFDSSMSGEQLAAVRARRDAEIAAIRETSAAMAQAEAQNRSARDGLKAYIDTLAGVKSERFAFAPDAGDVRAAFQRLSGEYQQGAKNLADAARIAMNSGVPLADGTITELNRLVAYFQTASGQIASNNLSDAVVNNFDKAKSSLQQLAGQLSAGLDVSALERGEQRALALAQALGNVNAQLSALENGGSMAAAAKPVNTAAGKPVNVIAPPSVGKAGGGSDPKKTMVEKLAALKAENDLIQQQIGGNGELIRQKQVELEIEKAITVDMRKKHPELAAQIEAEIRLKQVKQEQLYFTQIGRDLAADGMQKLWDGMMKVGEGTLKMKDFMKQFVVEMIKATAQAYILKPLMDSIKNPGGPGGGGIGGMFSSLFGGGSSGGGIGSFGSTFSFGFAKGGAFANDNVRAFATGGTFSNGIVDQTTPFAFGNGKLGVMGEAGPEAVMPLSRGARGLGVHTVDGGVMSIARNGAGQLAVDPRSHVSKFAMGGVFVGSSSATPFASGGVVSGGTPMAAANNSKPTREAASAPVINAAFTFNVEGDINEATVERLRVTMREEIATAAPRIVKESINGVGREHRQNKNYLKR